MEKKPKTKDIIFTQQDAVKEFEELKNIALNCYDKYGNPNVQAAIRALENKAKIAGLYKDTKTQIANFVKMEEITLDGKCLTINTGDKIDNDKTPKDTRSSD